MTRKHLAIALAILALSLILRAWNLGEVPFGRDEFLDINATVGYAKTGTWRAWDHNLGQVSARVNPQSDARAWIYRYQVAKLFDFLPPTEAVARSVSVFWGVVTTALVYLMGVSFTRRREAGLLAALFYALSINALEIDRTLRMYAMFVPVFAALSWVMFSALERAPYRSGFLRFLRSKTGLHFGFLLAAAVLGVLALELHLLAVNIAFALFLFALLRMFSADGRRYGIYLSAVVLAAGVSAWAIPEKFAQISAGLKFFENHYAYLGIILRDFAHPLLGGLLIVWGWTALWRAGRRSEALWLAATVGGITLAAIFLWNRVVGKQYIAMVAPFVSVSVATGVYYLARYLESQLYGRRVFAAILLLALALVPNYGYFFAENNTYHITAAGDRPDYRKIFTYVKKNLVPGDVLVTRNFRNYYWSGAGVKVFDFGSERSAEALAREGKVRKITREYIAQIVAEHPSGWVIFSDNDEKFISKEARAWMAENLRRLSHSALRGKVVVYRWGRE